MQHMLMSPEYPTFISQISSYMNDLPSPLTNIVVGYFNPPKHIWLQTSLIVATTTDGHVVVVDPSTMKELRRVPLTPRFVRFMKRHRGLDAQNAQYRYPNRLHEELPPQWGISPIDYNTLIRVDTIDCVESATNIEQTNVSWIRLDSGVSSVEESSDNEHTGNGGAGMRCIASINTTQGYLDNLASTIPWFSWCGR
jgi:hypothetical protein